jgi:hypothetical protein
MTSKMAEGKRKYLLAKKVSFKGQEMTKEQMIELLVRNGGRLRQDHFPKYHFSRTTFNRMDNAEQRQYEEKLKIKMPYGVQLPDDSYYEITKTEAELFLSLGGPIY